MQQKKRLESNFGKKNADDMDIGGVEEKTEHELEHGAEEEQQQEWDNDGYGDINAAYGGKGGWGKSRKG